MTHNKTDKSEWCTMLPVYFSGRAQASLAEVEDDDLDDYDKIKERMLVSLGDTPASADHKWWKLSRLPSEDPGAFYLRVGSTGRRRMDGLKSREEMLEKMILSRFLSLLPQDCYASVVDRNQNGREAAWLVQDWEDTRGFPRRSRPWRTGQRPYNSFRGSESESQGGYSNNGSNTGSRVASSSSSSGNVASTGSVSSSSSNVSTRVAISQDNPSRQASGGAGRNERGNQREWKTIVYFGCGETGHIKSKCPNKVRRVTPTL